MFVSEGPWLIHQVVECLYQLPGVNVPGGEVFVSEGPWLIHQVVKCLCQEARG